MLFHKTDAQDDHIQDIYLEFHFSHKRALHCRIYLWEALAIGWEQTEQASFDPSQVRPEKQWNKGRHWSNGNNKFGDMNDVHDPTPAKLRAIKIPQVGNYILRAHIFIA